jgi:hypothetical protein
MLKTKWQHYADQQKMCFHSSSSLNQVKWCSERKWIVPDVDWS